MIPKDIKILIENIIDKTKDKKAFWAKGIPKNEYMLILDNGSIIISVRPDGFYECEYDEIYDNLVEFCINDKFGDYIFKYTALDSIDSNNDYRILIQLHNEAEKEYLRKEETFVGIISEIKSDKIIGFIKDIENSKDDDDDTLY